MGDIRAYYDHDWSGAEASYQRAKELDPNLGPEYRYWIWLARYDLAIETIEAKLAETDPLSCHRQMRIGFNFYFARKYDRARGQAQVALKLDPNDSLSKHLIDLCNMAVGKGELNFVAEKIPTWISHLDSEEANEIFRAGGMSAIFEESAKDPNWPGPHDKPYDIACRYALGGNKDKAFEWVQKAYEFPLMIPFFTDARLDSLRDDPRYEDLLRQFNLPEDVVVRHLSR
jgi:tetratricopeptide (TPR) repeat protein